MTHLDYVPALLCKTLTTLISEFYHCNIWLVVCGTTSVDSLVRMHRDLLFDLFDTVGSHSFIPS